MIISLQQSLQHLKKRYFAGAKYVAYKSNAYQYQADEAYRMIAEKKIESQIMSSSDTIETLELLEAILANTKKVG